MNTIDIPEAIKKLRSQVALLDTSATSLAEHFASIAALALACSSQARRAQAIMNAAQYDQSGYTPEDSVWCHSFYCDIRRRPKDGGNGEYLLMADLGQGMKQPVGHFSRAPGVADLSEALLQAGLLDATLPLGHEYAINVDDTNDYPSNFISRTMRDRAVDELICALGADERPSIVTFEIEADGTQSNEEWIEIDDWIQERGLPANEPSTAALSAARARA